MRDKPGPDVTGRVNAALDGRYRIEREVGAGGMATVYVAHDLRHDRRVALKILKPELAAVMGAERFLSEIRTTANLQHPHILQLYDSGEADGFLYFVMPYVEGETLRAQIDREKQLPVEEAVGLARAIAAALQSAHEQGVVHRDIKPANILLSHGEPLVADFGIALAVQHAGGGRLTETGLSLGTPFYMSPEQATADRDPDARSDIYSLGSMLYEMLCGEPPFTGNTAQAVLGKILTATPARPTEYRKAIPPHVEAVILKALERLPADRFATAAEFGKALGDQGFRHGVTAEGPGASAASAAVAGLNRRMRALAGTTAVLAGALVWSLATRDTAPSTQSDTVAFYVYADTTHEISTGFPGSVALSPDGRMLAYTGRRSGTLRIYVRRMDEPDARMVPGTEGANSVFFSHDGAWLGYGTETYDVLKVRLAGGTPATVAKLQNTLTNGFWAEDGYIYYGETGLPGLMRVSADGGTPEELFPQSDSVTGVIDPWVLPDGKTVLASILYRGTQMLAYDMEAGQAKILGLGINPRYVDGHLIYGAEDGTLLAHPFDPDAVAFTAEPVRIAEGVGGWLNISRDFTVAPNGALAFVAGLSGTNQLVWSQRDPGGASAGVVIAGAQSLRTPRISPDGDQVAYVEGSSPQADIYVASRSQGTSRLVASAVGSIGASWSPDGTRLIYTSGDIRTPSVWAISLARGGEPELLIDNDDTIYSLTLPNLTWDGRYVVLERGISPRDIVALPLDGGEALVVAAGPGDERQSVPSPTGPWVAYTSDVTGRLEVYIAPLEGGGPIPISSGGGLSPAWSHAGDSIFYYPAAGAQGLQVAALELGDNPRVTGRGAADATSPPLEVVTLPAQYDMHEVGMALIAASTGGDRIVVRTHFLPSGN